MEPNTSAPQVPPVLPATSAGPVPATPGFSPSVSPEPSNGGASVPQPLPPTGAPVTPMAPPARVSAEPIPSISVPSVETTSSTSSALPASGPRLAPLPPSAFAPRPIPSPLTPPAGPPASVLQPTQIQPSASTPSSPTATSAPSEVDIAKLDELKKRLEELKLQTGIAPAPMTPQANQAPSFAPSPTISSTLAPQQAPTAQPAVPFNPTGSAPAETDPSLPKQSFSPADVPASVTSPDALTMAPKLPSAEATPAKKHSSKTALILILVIALLAVGGFVAYTILSRPSTPRPIINNEMPVQAGDSMNPPVETSPDAINMESVPTQDEPSLAEPLPQDGYAEPTPTETDSMGEVQGMMDTETSIQIQE